MGVRAESSSRRSTHVFRAARPSLVILSVSVRVEKVMMLGVLLELMNLVVLLSKRDNT